MITRIASTLLLTLVIATLACAARGRTVDDPAARSRDAATARWTEHRMRVGSLTRWFRVYRPADLEPDAPCVFVLHGGTQSMTKIFEANAGGSRAWRDVADREGVVLIVPNGTNERTGRGRGNRQIWNDLRPGRSEADDVAFIRELVAWTVENQPVDPDRIYVTGGSNGGMMTYRLLMECLGEFAAAAAFVANLPEDRSRVRVPTEPTPLMICNGTEDPLVQWDGGEIGNGRGVVVSAEETFSWWVQANGAREAASSIESLPDTDPSDGCRVHRMVHPAEAGGAEVIVYRVEGGGHALPSRRYELRDSRLIQRVIGPECRDVESADLAWAFFARHGGDGK